MTNGSERRTTITMKGRGEAFWKQRLNRAVEGLMVQKMAQSWTRYYMKRTDLHGARSNKLAYRTKNAEEVKRTANALFRRLSALSKDELVRIVLRRLCEHGAPPCVGKFVVPFVNAVLGVDRDKYRNPLIYLASLSGRELVETMTELYRRKEACNCREYNIVMRQRRGLVSLDIVPR